MACNCGNSKKSKAGQSWVHITLDGKVTTFATEADARTKAAREGGRVRPA